MLARARLRAPAEISDCELSLFAITVHIQVLFEGNVNVLSRDMMASSIHAVLLPLTTICKRQCEGQFFRIEMDNIPMDMEEPVLLLLKKSHTFALILMSEISHAILFFH